MPDETRQSTQGDALQPVSLHAWLDQINSEESL